MIRCRFVLVAVLVTLGAAAVGVPGALASNGTTVPPKLTSLPPLDKVPVTGIAKNGKTFSGTYAIQKFVASTSKVYAVGTLTGRLDGRHVTRYDVMIPAQLSDTAPMARDAQASCQVLYLELGPIDLNLLGLRVQLGGGTQANLPIVLNITAYPSQGILGSLLCDLTSALNQSGILSSLQTQLQQLAATLTSLTSLFGALPPL